METNAYGAEFGRNSGGQIHVDHQVGRATSCTAARTSSTATTRSTRATSSTPATSRTSRATSSAPRVGGPIRKDRTFFFVGSKALRERLGRTISTVVPDDDARARAAPGPAQPGRAAHGPRRARRCGRTSTPYPLPNGASLGGGLAAYSFPFDQTLDQDYFQARARPQLRRGRTSSSCATPTTTPSSSCPPTSRSSRATFLSREPVRDRASTATCSSRRTLHTARARLRAAPASARTSRPNLRLAAGPVRARPAARGRHRHRRHPALRARSRSATSRSRQNVLGAEYGIVHTRGPPPASRRAPWPSATSTTCPTRPSASASTPSPNLEAFLRNRAACASSASRPRRTSTATGASRCSAGYLQDEFRVDAPPDA